jgi:hypothetical protein
VENTTLSLEDVEVSKVSVARASLPSKPGFYFIGDDGADDVTVVPSDDGVDDATI